MTNQPVFSQRLLVGWISAAIIIFAISLYFMGGGQFTDPGVLARVPTRARPSDTPELPRCYSGKISRSSKANPVLSTS